MKTNIMEIESQLVGMDFPAQKNEIVEYAKKMNANDEIIDALGKIPDRKYKKPADVSHELEKIDVESGGEEEE